jgi:four helix bundle protein
MRIHDYEKLQVWQKSMQLVVDVYSMTKTYPSTEQFGLTSQMRRAAVSIPSNIAEGSRRSTEKDFRNFLITALGSASELETQLKIAFRLGYSKQENLPLLTEVIRMLAGLIK